MARSSSQPASSSILRAVGAGTNGHSAQRYNPIWPNPLKAEPHMQEGSKGLESFGTPADATRPVMPAALAPLSNRLFRSLWIAAVVSYTGTWMQNVGAGWLMAMLTLSPLMVGLVQAANTVPVFLLILPAGALADIVDRRRLLIAMQT